MITVAGARRGWNREFRVAASASESDRGRRSISARGCPQRGEFEPITHAQPGDSLPDYAHDQQGPFEPPFTLPNREEDTAQAYEYFQGLLGDET